MKNENDLRVIKTRKNIIDSFLALLAKKPLEEISVTEICAGANCSRNTFYLHYPYKEALYNSLIDELIEQVRSGFLPGDRESDESYLDYAVRKIRLMGHSTLSVREKLRPLMSCGHADTFFRRLQNELYITLYASGIKQMKLEYADSQTYQLICWYSSGAIVGFLMGNIYDVDMPEDEALDILCRLHVNAFKVSEQFMK